MFLLVIVFPKDYPCKAPKLAFTNKIYHPAVNEDGVVGWHNGGFDDSWGPDHPDCTLRRCLQNLVDLLQHPEKSHAIMNAEADALFKSDPEGFGAKAREWTLMYA